MDKTPFKWNIRFLFIISYFLKYIKPFRPDSLKNIFPFYNFLGFCLLYFQCRGFHVNVWQNQYSIVKQNKVKIKIKKKRLRLHTKSLKNKNKQKNFIVHQLYSNFKKDYM